MYKEYFLVFEYFFIAIIISILLFSLSFLLVYQVPDSEKSSVYECGFNPFGDARIKFEVKFYLISILFIILI